MRRVGRVLTGVDRVELAYLLALQDQTEPVFGLIRSRYGYILLDPRGVAAMTPILSGSDSTDAWRRARQVAMARCVPFGLPRMLARHLLPGTAYLNTGHSNLTDRVLRAMKAGGIPVAALVHDVIPLEFPQYQRDGTVEAFRGMIDRLAAMADLLIYNSQDTKQRAEAQMPGTPPPAIVAHLGTNIAAPEPQELPPDLPLTAPYFLTIGTIEPRKNPAFLLDLWDKMGPDAPTLLIAGSRGWRSEGVFARLDALPTNGPVREVSGLSDGALAALIEGAAGVLLPSFAEGFGLPAVEAAARGVPVVVNTLDVYAEFLGDIPIYASVSDRYLWIKTINTLAEAEQRTQQEHLIELPNWDAHFKTVLRLT